jgi:hypothetical protein
MTARACHVWQPAAAGCRHTSAFVAAHGILHAMPSRDSSPLYIGNMCHHGCTTCPLEQGGVAALSGHRSLIDEVDLLCVTFPVHLGSTITSESCIVCRGTLARRLQERSDDIV